MYLVTYGNGHGLSAWLFSSDKLEEAKSFARNKTLKRMEGEKPSADEDIFLLEIDAPRVPQNPLKRDDADIIADILICQVDKNPGDYPPTLVEKVEQFIESWEKWDELPSVKENERWHTQWQNSEWRNILPTVKIQWIEEDSLLHVNIE
ncbi:MAG: hypothetical protein WBB28_01650 [Crinalium sp.]